MIFPHTLYGATCDRCDKQWEHYHEGWAYVDENAITEYLSDAGWSVNELGDDIVYCPGCFSFDDEDVFHVKPQTHEG